MAIINSRALLTCCETSRRYVQYFNVTYGRSGTLWEGRYRATVIDSEPYLLTCMRYSIGSGLSLSHPS